MFADEVRELLQDLLEAVKGLAATISDDELQPGAGQALLSKPLSSNTALYVRLPALMDSGAIERAEAELERSARAIRACARRWQMPNMPSFSVAATRTPGRARVLDSIRGFLSAFVAAHGLDNAVVLLRGSPIVTAFDLSDAYRERLPFIERQVVAEAGRRVTSSHGEAHGDDFYAVSFWYDACLVGFFSAPIAIDFVRHRARLVTRELCNLIPMLEDEPTDPAVALEPDP